MATKVKLECKINQIEQVPNSRVYLISVQYKQGNKTWHKGWRFTPAKPVSMEWLEREIAKLDPWPDEDLMKNVIDEAPRSKFTIEVNESVKAQTTEAIAATEFEPQMQAQQISVPPGTVIE